MQGAVGAMEKRLGVSFASCYIHEERSGMLSRLPTLHREDRGVSLSFGCFPMQRDRCHYLREVSSENCYQQSQTYAELRHGLRIYREILCVGAFT